MERIPYSSKKIVFLLLSIITAMALMFVLFGHDSNILVTNMVNALNSSFNTLWLFSTFVIVILAFDVVLPIPSSIVAVFASTTLGPVVGSVVIWLGLMSGCFLGYVLGAGSGKVIPEHWMSDGEFKRARQLSRSTGPWILIAARGVPILAETSVIAAGITAYPVIPFIIIMAMSNAGLAVAYGYLGQYIGTGHSALIVIASSVVVPCAAWLLKGVLERLFRYLSLSRHDDGSEQKILARPCKQPTIHNIIAKFKVSYHYSVIFENQVFDTNNPTFRNLFSLTGSKKQSLFFLVDSGVIRANPCLSDSIHRYCKYYEKCLHLIAPPELVTGGEAAKKNEEIENIYKILLMHNLDRHSCVVVIGGGAVLDAVGYACATFHRGIKLLRMPTTVLAQNDAGVGVKNGYNAFGNKNLIGTFQPPFAVINDASLLHSLTARDRIAGLAEAVKVAAIRDSSFFRWIEEHVLSLRQFENDATGYVIARCAQLHLQQITGAGDPFESGSERPLDYGHWCAHKLEVMDEYRIRHGEAVAIGMALDARYAVNIGLLAEKDALRLINLLEKLGFDLWHSALSKIDSSGELLILAGLEEFRQHLGGELCITLLSALGMTQDRNVIDAIALNDALTWLKERCMESNTAKAQLKQNLALN